MSYDDPGWMPAIKRAWRYILFPAWPVQRPRPGDNPLIALRTVFLSSLLALAVVGNVLTFVEPDGPPRFGTLHWFIAAYAVVGSVGGVAWARRRSIVVTDVQTVAGSYRGLVLISFGLAHSVALMGFVLVFITGYRWTFAAGLGVALPLLALVAPTRADIERRQRQVTAAGSAVSVSRAVQDVPMKEGRAR
ncbi:MAG: hypothetical protein WD770_08240 [Actinomycetota bacterium]